MKNTKQQNIETKKFLEFNGKVIYFIAADGKYWIALKPICEALGISWKYQHEKLQKDTDIFGQLSREHGIVAADNRLRKMTCLQERYIYDWIFTIQLTSQMNQETQQNLSKYKIKCCDILFEHFQGMITQREQILKTKTLDELEIESLELELEESEQYKRILQLRGLNKKRLAQLRNLDKDLVSAQLDLWKQEKTGII